MGSFCIGAYSVTQEEEKGKLCSNVRFSEALKAVNQWVPERIDHMYINNVAHQDSQPTCLRLSQLPTMQSPTLPNILSKSQPLALKTHH